MNLESLFSGNVWEDLVKDFLEMSCFLKPEEQQYLIQELQRQKIKAEDIDVHPCFSINGRVVIVCEEITPRECWLYYVKKQEVQRWTGIERRKPSKLQMIEVR